MTLVTPCDTLLTLVDLSTVSHAIVHSILFDKVHSLCKILDKHLLHHHSHLTNKTCSIANANRIPPIIEHYYNVPRIPLWDRF